MKTVNDLISLKLYPSTDKLYIPIDKEDKRHGSCIGILGNSDSSIINIINSDNIINRDLYKSYYTEKSVSPIINESSIEEDTDEVITEVTFVNNEGKTVPKECPKCGSKVGVFFRGEPVFLCSNKKCNEYFGTLPFPKKESKDMVSESIMFKNKSKFVYMNGSPTAIKEISKYINGDAVTEINRRLDNAVNLKDATFNIFIYDKIPKDTNISKSFNIHVMSPIGFDEDINGPYEYYVRHELALSMITSINPKINNNLAIYIAMVISDQYRIIEKLNIDNVVKNGATVINNIYMTKGPKKIKEIIIDNDISYISKYSAKPHINDIKNLFD